MNKPVLYTIIGINALLLVLSGGSLVYYLSSGGAGSPVTPDPAKPAVSREISASVEVKTVPDGAKVFIDGYFRGMTPIEFKVTSVDSKSEYRLTVIKQGYEKWQNDIKLAPGDERDFEIKLEGSGK
ncbi:MAG: PEGA domain-containing protein [Elusimicrobia bacterium]|nr:PEGA domain-containing protein [Elusimicrobiota bacterium]